MPKSLILHCTEPLLDFSGQEVKEPDPDRPGQMRAITTGRLIGNFISQGKGLPPKRAAEIQALSMELLNEDEVTLSPPDVKLIMGVLERGFSEGQLQGWVLGHFQYLLDPDQVTKETRARLAKRYEGRPAVVTEAPLGLTVVEGQK